VHARGVSSHLTVPIKAPGIYTAVRGKIVVDGEWIGVSAVL